MNSISCTQEPQHPHYTRFIVTFPTHPDFDLIPLIGKDNQALHRRQPQGGLVTSKVIHVQVM